MKKLKKIVHFAFWLAAAATPPVMAATVDNPGAVTITALPGSWIRIGTGLVFTFTNSHTISGQVAADGTLTLPADQAVFQPVFIMVGGFSITAQLVATQDGFGSINPITGDAFLTMMARVDLSGFLVPAGCSIPETPLTFTVSGPGGIPYDSFTGTATVVDNTFALSASSGCGLLGGLINSYVGLPSASGQNVMQLNVSVSPILVGSEDPPC